MVDWTKPIQTRDGRKARVLCTDMKGRCDSVVGITTEADGTENSGTWRRDGTWCIDGAWHELDIINAPEKRVVWVNMYPVHSDSRGWPETSQRNCDKSASEDREACIRVEYEVGQFDEE